MNNNIVGLMQNLMSGYSGFMNNRQKYMGNLNIPSDINDNPNQIIQYLMNNGYVSQDLYNQASQLAYQIKTLRGF